MQERLREIEAKYAELERKMAEPEYYSDAEAYAKLAKEQKELAPLATACREYFKCEADIADAKELLSDPEMAELAREELEAAKARLEELEEEIKLLMLPATRTTGKTSSLRYAPASAGRNPRCSRAASTVCTPCTPSPAAGSWRSRT